jgi:hypothetical protein
VFAGALFGFVLARLEFLSYQSIFCGNGTRGAAPGECYYYDRDFYKIGMLLHLSTILPAGLLATLQFLPVIRQNAVLFHRLNGYVVLVLVLVSIVGALMIARVAFGGGLDIQAAVGLLAIMTLGSLILAIFNIKRLRIDQHRAWMLRAWFYMGSIITTRIIMIIATVIITKIDDYYTARPCAQLQYVSKDAAREYPECQASLNGTNPSQFAVVHANFNGQPTEIGAALGISFAMAFWLSIAIHAIGIEIYVSVLIILSSALLTSMLVKSHTS